MRCRGWRCVCYVIEHIINIISIILWSIFFIKKPFCFISLQTFEALRCCFAVFSISFFQLPTRAFAGFLVFTMSDRKQFFPGFQNCVHAAWKFFKAIIKLTHALHYIFHRFSFHTELHSGVFSSTDEHCGRLSRFPIEF